MRFLLWGFNVALCVFFFGVSMIRRCIWGDALKGGKCGGGMEILRVREGERCTEGPERGGSLV